MFMASMGTGVMGGVGGDSLILGRSFFYFHICVFIKRLWHGRAHELEKLKKGGAYSMLYISNLQI